jgi:hypothetical protein
MREQDERKANVLLLALYLLLPPLLPALWTLYCYVSSLSSQYRGNDSVFVTMLGLALMFILLIAYPLIAIAAFISLFLITVRHCRAYVICLSMGCILAEFILIYWFRHP